MVGDSPNIAKFYIWNVEIMFLQIVDMVKQTPTYKNKMKAFELKHNQARTNKKKGSKNKIRLVLFEFHMKKNMPLKGRVLAFMMKFSMGIFFSCWVCEVY
jgi:DnaJ family protein C protein 25